MKLTINRQDFTKIKQTKICNVCKRELGKSEFPYIYCLDPDICIVCHEKIMEDRLYVQKQLNKLFEEE